MMKFNEQHFASLLECHRAISIAPDMLDRAWVGRSAKDWYRSAFGPSDIPPGLGDRPLDRTGVAALITSSQEGVSDEDALLFALEIFAWGKMSAKNARAALGCQAAWLPIGLSMLRGEIDDPVSAYGKFFELHNVKPSKIQGLGPAYYTKLIYFLCAGGGLIMDQWTSRSANLLDAEGPFVRMSRDQRGALSVKANNGPEVYARYLEFVRELASEISSAPGHQKPISPSHAEALIFSTSEDVRKRPKTLTMEEHAVASQWRRYVKANS